TEATLAMGSLYLTDWELSGFYPGPNGQEFPADFLEGFSFFDVITSIMGSGQVRESRFSAPTPGKDVVDIKIELRDRKGTITTEPEVALGDKVAGDDVDIIGIGSIRWHLSLSQ